MSKDKMIQIAERNLKRAEMALFLNEKRSGITKTELQNLLDNVEYAKAVLDLITKN